MASLMPKTANGKNRANKASTPLEMEPSLKKFKSSDISFPPPTIEVFNNVPPISILLKGFRPAATNVGSFQNPEGSKQGSPSSGKNQDEELLNEYFRIYQEMRGSETVLQNRDVFLKRVEPLLSPEFRTPLDDLSLSKIEDSYFNRIVSMLELFRGFLSYEDHCKKTITSLVDIISGQDKRISLLKSNMDLKSVKLAEVEAKLKKYELSKAHLSSRVESLEAELNERQVDIEFLKYQAVTSEQKASLMAEKIVEMQKYSNAYLSSRVESLEAELSRKQAEIEVLKNEVVASEKKASRVENKIIEMQKYSEALSSAAAKSIEDLKSSEEKSQDSDANLLLYLASSNQL